MLSSSGVWLGGRWQDDLAQGKSAGWWRETNDPPVLFPRNLPAPASFYAADSPRAESLPRLPVLALASDGSVTSPRDRGGKHHARK
jgi:hypothetical protein